MAEITSPRRGKTNGYSNHHLHAKKNQKRKDAEARQAVYSKLSLSEKMNSLIADGSRKQRAKLEKLAASASTPAEPTKTVKKTKKS